MLTILCEKSFLRAYIISYHCSEFLLLWPWNLIVPNSLLNSCETDWEIPTARIAIMTARTSHVGENTLAGDFLLAVGVDRTAWKKVWKIINADAGLTSGLRKKNEMQSQNEKEDMISEVRSCPRNSVRHVGQK